MRSVKYIVRFDLPLDFLGVENDPEGIIDTTYDTITAAQLVYDRLKKYGLVDLIEIKDGVEYCLM